MEIETVIAAQPSWKSSIFLRSNEIAYYDFVEMVLVAPIFHLNAAIKDEFAPSSNWHHFIISEVKSIFKLIEHELVEQYVLNVQNHFGKVGGPADFTIKKVKTIIQCEQKESGGRFYFVTCDDESSFVTPYFNPKTDGELIKGDVCYTHIEYEL